MADRGTEQATPLRKKKAKEKGDTAHSRELLSAVAMLAGVVMLGAMSENLVSSWSSIYRESVRSATTMASGGDAEQACIDALRSMITPAVLPVGLIMSASFIGALMSGLAQSGGLRFYPNSVALKLSKINPITNLGNLFSLRSATRVLKSLVPASVMVVLGCSALKALIVPMPVMSLLRLPETFSMAYRLALEAGWVTLVWSGLDYAIEWRSWNQRLKMSKHEMREEIRDAMGNPQIKAKIRQIQRAMRKRRVKADMSRASVVITNPTHYAVVLEFSFETMSAPTVLAKGRDLLAAEIREEARWAGVPIVENPPLARSLYKMADPGQSIPFELYAAVAGILAYLYRQRVEERVRKDHEEGERIRQVRLRGHKASVEALAMIEMRDFVGGM